MGPVAHLVTGKLLGLPAASNVWMDAPHVVATARPQLAREAQLVANATHSWPGLVLAALLWGRRGALGWALHVALDTFSHDPGQGSHGRTRKVWLP